MRQFDGDFLVVDGFRQRFDVFFLVENLAQRFRQLSLQSLLRLTRLFQPSSEMDLHVTDVFL